MTWTTSCIYDGCGNVVEPRLALVDRTEPVQGTSLRDNQKDFCSWLCLGNHAFREERKEAKEKAVAIG